METDVLIFEHDVHKYPPILSIINFLMERKHKIVFIGCCYDEDLINRVKDNGVEFYNIIDNNVKSNNLRKFARLTAFKRDVGTIVNKINIKDTDRVWLFGETCIWLLNSLVYRFKCITYLFEMPHLSVSFKYKLLSPNINYKQVLQKAFKVICCEYNRAHITRSYFNLPELPLIIPNKPYGFTLKNESKVIPRQLVGKKVILYQGIFNYPERKMDDLCDTIELLDDDFVICLMGSDNVYKESLKKKYSFSNRIVFLPYIPAPLHLEITKHAYIGYLSYFGESGNIRNSLNTLYCAPNKVFEYSRFSIPMLSNDVPALDYLFEKYNAGLTSKASKESVFKQIMKIDAEYVRFSSGSKALYDAVDLESIYLEIIK